jgi:hypothetical protein
MWYVTAIHLLCKDQLICPCFSQFWGAANTWTRDTSTDSYTSGLEQACSHPQVHGAVLFSVYTNSWQTSSQIFFYGQMVHNYVVKYSPVLTEHQCSVLYSLKVHHQTTLWSNSTCSLLFKECFCNLMFFFFHIYTHLSEETSSLEGFWVNLVCFPASAMHGPVTYHINIVINNLITTWPHLWICIKV